MLAVEGRVQREGLVVHIVADKLIDLTERLAASVTRMTAFSGDPRVVETLSPAICSPIPASPTPCG
jgi:hypothetical protein